MSLAPLRHHPGLDPGSIAATALWTPDQVQGDDMEEIAREVAQFSGHPA